MYITKIKCFQKTFNLISNPLQLKEQSHPFKCIIFVSFVQKICIRTVDNCRIQGGCQKLTRGCQKFSVRTPLTKTLKPPLGAVLQKLEGKFGLNSTLCWIQCQELYYTYVCFTGYKNVGSFVVQLVNIKSIFYTRSIILLYRCVL